MSLLEFIRGNSCANIHPDHMKEYLAENHGHFLMVFLKLFRYFRTTTIMFEYSCDNALKKQYYIESINKKNYICFLLDNIICEYDLVSNIRSYFIYKNDKIELPNFLVISNIVAGNPALISRASFKNKLNHKSCYLYVEISQDFINKILEAELKIEYVAYEIDSDKRRLLFEKYDIVDYEENYKLCNMPVLNKRCIHGSSTPFLLSGTYFVGSKFIVVEESKEKYDVRLAKNGVVFNNFKLLNMNNEEIDFNNNVFLCLSSKEYYHLDIVTRIDGTIMIDDNSSIYINQSYSYNIYIPENTKLFFEYGITNKYKDVLIINNSKIKNGDYNCVM